MKSRSSPSLGRMAVAGLAVLWMADTAVALGQVYCSNENTGSEYEAVSNMYNSNGACYSQCQDEYAFAIVQWQSCWCSNYIPASTENSYECSQTCPGYPNEACGNQQKGLYGYVKLQRQPSGTAGSSSESSTPTQYSSSTSTSTPKTSSEPSPSPTSSSTPSVSPTVYRTVTPEASTSYLVSTVSLTPSTTETPTSTTSTRSSTTSTTTSSTSTQSPKTVYTPTPVTSLEVITVSGAPITQTVTSTPTALPNPLPADNNQLPIRNSGLSGGAIAGIVIGVLAGVAAILVIAFLLWRRRRKDDKPGPEIGFTKSPMRNTSVLSKTGLLARSGTKREPEWDEPLYVNTNTTGNNSVRHSALYVAGAMGGEGVSPVSPLEGPRSENNLSRRPSRPLVYDQRLNPSALFANHDNGSRVSMQDQQDYSRPLGVANPDPRPSFESRVSHG